MISKIWTSESRRTAMAAYAETGQRDIDSIGDSVAAVMRMDGTVFYKLEDQTGVFLGFLIEKDGLYVTGYIRASHRTVETYQFVPII